MKDQFASFEVKVASFVNFPLEYRLDSLIEQLSMGAISEETYKIVSTAIQNRIQQFKKLSKP